MQCLTRSVWRCSPSGLPRKWFFASTRPLLVVLVKQKILHRLLLRRMWYSFLPLSHLLPLRRGWWWSWLHSTHTSRCPRNAFRQVWPSGPWALVWVEHLSGSGEHHILPAVAPQHIDPPCPNGKPRLAVGQQQWRHPRPLASVRVVGLYLQDVEALRGVFVVIAAPDGVDEVIEGGHAVPAPGQRHGLAFYPHIAVPWRIVTQDFPAIRTDLIVVTARDVDYATVDGPSMAVSKPRKDSRSQTTVKNNSWQDCEAATATPTM